MKHKKTLIVLLVAGTGLGILAATCSGKYCHRDPQRHSAWLMEKASDELELNNSQQAKLKLFVDELAESRKSMRSQRKQSRETLMDMLKQPSLDRDKAQAFVQERLDTVQQRAPKLINSFADFYDTLSPEQREEMREELDEHFDSHHRKHHWK